MAAFYVQGGKKKALYLRLVDVLFVIQNDFLSFYGIWTCIFTSLVYFNLQHSPG